MAHNMYVLCVVFGVLLAVDLAVSQNLPGKPEITVPVPIPTVGVNWQLTCESTATSASLPTTIRWMKDSAFLNGHSQSTTSLVTTSVINIPITSHLMKDDVITCQASNDDGQRTSSIIISDVYQTPTVGEITPSGADLVAGTRGAYTVIVTDAYPGLTSLRWYVDGTETQTFTTSTTENSADRTYSYTSTMERDLVAADNGLVVRCEISHTTFTSVVTKYHVMIVSYPPGQPNITTNFQNGLNENAIMEGTCSSQGGHPTPTVTWIGTGISSSVTSNPADLLVVNQFQATAVVSLIGQTYTCTVQNSEGTFTATVTLSRVFVPPGAVVIQGFNNVVTEGIVMSLTCTSQGALPSASVTWTHPDGSRDTSYSTEQNQTWTVSVNTLDYTARFEDTGKRFACNATNLAGDVYATTQPLTVYVQPPAPDLTGPNEAYEGTAVNYTCVTLRANPAPNMYWLVDATVRGPLYSPTSTTNGDGTFLTRSTLTIVPTAALATIDVTCEIDHITFTSTLQSSIGITVRMKPTVVLTSPSSENVLITAIYSIDCVVTSAIEFNITWYHVSLSSVTQPLTNDNSKYMMWSRSSTIETLSIQNYQSSDDGRYFAIASNHAGQSSPSATAQTTGYAIPTTPVIHTFDLYPVEGTTVVMNCTSTGGVPNTVITWYRDDVVLDTSSTTTTNIGSLTYNDYSHSAVFADKGAVFKCEASNVFGNTSATRAFNDVYVPPAVPTITGVDIVWESHTYSWIGSTSASNPAASISWTHGGKNVTSQARLTQEPNTQKPGTFNVYSNLTLHIAEADVGKILTCFVHHVTLAGSSLSTNHPLIVYLIPTAYVAEQNTEAEIGTIRVLTCNVDTELPATVTWYKTGSTEALQHNQLNYIIGQRTLTFNPVILAHAGSYMCSAFNHAGSSGLSAAVDFTVYQLPSTPVITEFPVTAVEGRTSYINATSSGGYPLPTLTWARNGVVVDALSTLVGSTTYNNYSFVASLADIRVPFTATVANAYGTFSASDSLSDVYAPATPPAIDGASVAYEGTPVTHGCSSARARPAPALYWFLGDTDMTSQATQSTVSNADLLTVQATSSLTFTPTADDVGKALICVLHQPDGHDTNLTIILSLTTYLKPRVSLAPVSTDVEIGTNKVIRCIVDSVLDYTVLWYIDSSVIATPDANYVMSGEFLTILDFATTDNGAYSCIGQNTAGLSSQSDQLSLTAYASPGVPTITITPSSVPNENDVVTLTCTTSNGVPSPSVTWSKDGTTQFNDITTSVTDTSVTSTLTFVVSFVTDTGAEYTCTTTNSFGTRSTSATIPVVHVPPTLEQTTVSGISTVYEGSSSEFYCVSDRSFPQASIIWILEQEVLQGQFSLSANDDGTYKTSSNLTHQARYSDSGIMNLVCRVSHAATTTSIDKPFQLYGYSKPRVSISSPTFIVAKGSSLTLHCAVVSELGSTVTWYKSNTGQTLTSTDVYTFNGPNVTVQAVAVSDEGPYHCTATNTAGTSSNSNTGTVIVYAYPVTPVITGLENAVTENTFLTINCTSADGYPLPTITWYRDGVAILNAPVGLHSSYTFLVAFSDRVAEYTCSATNSYDTATSGPTTIPDVYALPTGVSLTGPPAVYQTKMSVFLCTVTRVSPNPTFRWLVGTTVVTSSSNITALENNLQISSYFSHVFKPGDMGKNITCIVTQVETSTVVMRIVSVVLHLLPEILNPAENRNVELFTTPSITCVVSSTDPNYNVMWYKDGTLIDATTSNGKYSMSNDALTITSFQVTDSGLYTCTASHQGGTSAISQPTNLTAFGYPIKPTIIASHPAMIVIEGETLILNGSTVGGVPTPTLVWRHGSAAQIVDTSFTSSLNGSSSFVYNVYSSVVTFSDNSSVYTCEAENSHLTVTETFRLRDVYVSPVPTLTVSAVGWNEASHLGSFYEDHTYTFNGSIPRFNPRTIGVRLLVDGVERNANFISNDVTSEGVYTYTSSLDVLMSTSLDGKVITFMVEHPETTSRNVSITIEILHKPRVSISSSSGLVVKGDSFPVTCDVVSSLEYNITWKIQGFNTTLVNSAKYSLTGAQGQTLTILNADYTDKVTYVCSAANSAGAADIEALFYLVVYKEVGQPVLGGFSRNVVDGDTIAVYCNSSGGDPPASIVWEKNGVVQNGAATTYGNDDANPVSSVLTLVVSYINDRNAVYTCTASNAYSSSDTNSRFNEVFIFSNSMSLTDLTTVTALRAYTWNCETSGMYKEPNPIWRINDIRQFNGITTDYANAADGTFTMTSNFTFTPTKDNNGQALVCVVDHTTWTGRSLEATRTLNVKFQPDTPIITGFNPDITENTAQSLLCTVSNGNPRPTVRWFKNNNLVTSTQLTEFTNSDGHYVTTNQYNFTASLQGDSGAEYTCHSQHVIRNLSASVQYGQIKAPPSNTYLTLPTEPLTAAQPQTGADPNLRAGASYMWLGTVGRAQPPPQVYWMLGSSFPSNHTPVSTDNADGTVSTVSTLYYAPTLADDGLNLNFIVYHPGTSSTTFTYTTKLVIHGPPVVLITQDSADIVIGNTFTGQCTVTSSLNAYTVKWFKGGAEVSSGARYSMNGDFLVITGVQFSDEGQYSCTATNAAGTSTRSNAVTVTAISGAGAPAITGFVLSPKEGDVLPLVCTAIGGVPTPSVIWKKNGAVVDSSDSSTISNGVTTTTNEWPYTVTFADRAATFTCLATNSVANKTRDKVFNDVYIPPIAGAGAIAGPTTTVEGSIDTYTLTFGRVNPAPAVSWLVGGVSLSSNVPTISSVVTAEGALNATASITFIQAAAYNAKVLVASVGHPESGTTFEVTTPLTVNSAPSAPTITGFPSTSTSIVGETHQLVCKTIGGYPPPTLRWYRDDVQVASILDTDTSVEPIVTTTNYNLAVALTQEGAVLRCTAQNTINTLSREVSLVDVYVRVDLAAIVGDSDVIAGKNTSLTCTTTACYPQPTLEWWLVPVAGVPVESLPVSALTTGSSDSYGRVTVESAVYFVPDNGDSGKTVRCIAKQVALPHTATSSLLITVHGRPTARAQSNSDKELNEGVTFTCAVTSSLSTYNVTWYKRVGTDQGTPITNVNEKYAVSANHPTYELWIYSIDVSDDGVYYCVAQSAAGRSADAEVSLTVYTAPTETTFENGLSDSPMVITEGSGIQASCLTTVHPANAASYTWYFSPITDATQTEVDAAYVTDNVLNIPSAASDRTRAGTYTCDAYNSYGSSRKSLTVDIQYPPELDVANVQTDFTSNVEDLVTLSCDVIANPAPTGYVWRHDNQDLATTKDLEVNVQAGENRYTCVATNNVGSSIGHVFTIVAEQDSPPDAGASTADTSGLSNGVIAAIVLGVIFILLILIICCVGCKYYKDKKSEDKVMRTTKKTKTKHKPSSVVPDNEDKRSTLYPTRDPTHLFGPARHHPYREQRHYPRDLAHLDYEYSQRGGYPNDPNTFYLPAPGSEMDDMSVFRETGFRSHRRNLPKALPPLATANYHGEAKRRKARSKKEKKKRQHERQAGEGMENPGKSKDTSPQIVLDDNRPEKDAAMDTNVLLGDQFKD